MALLAFSIKGDVTQVNQSYLRHIAQGSKDK